MRSGHPKIRIHTQTRVCLTRPHSTGQPGCSWCSASLPMMGKTLQLFYIECSLCSDYHLANSSTLSLLPYQLLCLSRYPVLLCSSGNLILASGSVRIPRFMLLESGGLRIAPVFIQDAGNYTCYAANTEASVNASAMLTVWSKDHSL